MTQGTSYADIDYLDLLIEEAEYVLNQCGYSILSILCEDNAGFQYLRIDLYTGKNGLSPICSYALPLREVIPNMAYITEDADQLASAWSAWIKLWCHMGWLLRSGLCTEQTRWYNVYETDNLTMRVPKYRNIAKIRYKFIVMLWINITMRLLRILAMLGLFYISLLGIQVIW